VLEEYVSLFLAVLNLRGIIPALRQRRLAFNCGDKKQVVDVLHTPFSADKVVGFISKVLTKPFEL
jgi:hypothetical protein